MLYSLTVSSLLCLTINEQNLSLNTIHSIIFFWGVSQIQHELFNLLMNSLTSLGLLHFPLSSFESDTCLI